MKKHLWLLPLLAAIFAGCGDIRGVTAQFVPVEARSPPRTITLARDLQFQPAGFHTRTLRKGSVWSLAGRVAPGDVYAPRDTQFTLENINLRQAYVVLAGGKLVGYYLPSENIYISEPKPIIFPVQAKL